VALANAPGFAFANGGCIDSSGVNGVIVNTFNTSGRAANEPFVIFVPATR
jgi:hypothetical protein